MSNLNAQPPKMYLRDERIEFVEAERRYVEFKRYRDGDQIKPMIGIKHRHSIREKDFLVGVITEEGLIKMFFWKRFNLPKKPKPNQPKIITPDKKIVGGSSDIIVPGRNNG